MTILKTLKVDIKLPKAPIVKEVVWFPPNLHWTKGHTDEAAVRNPDQASARRIFRNSDGGCLDYFVQNSSFGSGLFAELSMAMMEIEIANYKGCSNLWLETDSKLVLTTFSNISLVH